MGRKENAGRSGTLEMEKMNVLLLRIMAKRGICPKNEGLRSWRAQSLEELRTHAGF